MIFNIAIALDTIAACFGIIRSRRRKWRIGCKPKEMPKGRPLTLRDIRELNKLRSMNGNGKHKTGTHD